MPFLKPFKVCPEWKRKEQQSFKAGSRHTVFFLNGDQHTGEWKDNSKEGKGAELTRSRFLYEGDFANMKRHGHGVLSKQQSDGTFQLVYNGEWAHGRKHGLGIHRSSDGAWYDGSWRHGKRCGEGRAWLSDGSFYQGQWMDNLFHGQGLLLLPNGNRYEGEFHAGLKHGRGVFYHLDRALVQEGVWDEGTCVASILQAPTSAAENGAGSGIPPNELQNLDEVVSSSQQEALERTRSTGSWSGIARVGVPPLSEQDDTHRSNPTR